MKKIVGFWILSWVVSECLAPAMWAQAKLVDSSRYLFVYVSGPSVRFPQYLDDVTATKTGLYNKTLAATSSAGLLYASQNTTIGDGSFNGVMVASTASRPDAGSRASTDARVLVDYTVEKLSKYRLVVALTKTLTILSTAIPAAR